MVCWELKLCCEIFFAAECGRYFTWKHLEQQFYAFILTDRASSLTFISHLSSLIPFLKTIQKKKETAGTSRTEVF